MNIRRNVDYTDMYEAIDNAMAKELRQIELYYEIGKAIGCREEKGAAVAAAEYLQKTYPGIQGFSPRTVRRMRDFYLLYADNTKLLSKAMKLGWTQNLVLMDADLTEEERRWYIDSALQNGWSKSDLFQMIAKEAFLVARRSTTIKKRVKKRLRNLSKLFYSIAVDRIEGQCVFKSQICTVHMKC